MSRGKATRTRDDPETEWREAVNASQKTQAAMEPPQSKQEVAAAHKAAGFVGMLSEAADRNVLRYNELKLAPDLEAHFTGHGYDSTYALKVRFDNNGQESVEVSLSPGQLVAPGGKAVKQSLVLRDGLEATVPPGGSITLTAYAYCANVNFACSDNNTEMVLTPLSLNTGVLSSQWHVWRAVPIKGTRVVDHVEQVPTVEEQRGMCAAGRCSDPRLAGRWA